MKKKLIVLETFEQGMERKEGGAFKLLRTSADSPAYEALEADDGLQVRIGNRVRTIPGELLERLTGAGLVRVEDAA